MFEVAETLKLQQSLPTQEFASTTLGDHQTSTNRHHRVPTVFAEPLLQFLGLAETVALRFLDP